MSVVAAPVRLSACDCLTPLGDAASTHAALLASTCALRPTPVLGKLGGDAVPMALLPGRALDETAPPSWLPRLKAFLAPVLDRPWGSARYPVCVTSSNFGVGSLFAFRHSGGPDFVNHGTPHASVAGIARACDWGDNLAVFSHACVSAHLGLMHASRLLAAGAADEVLVFTYDFLSPFVAGGFHALKILNAQFPAPYMARETGSIALGDGAAYAVVTRQTGAFTIVSQSLHNEMHHFTANQPDGAGFAAVLAPLEPCVRGARAWVKGHGTGTLEAGRLEAEAMQRAFGDAPLVGWKGSLGHTLGSCGLVELALVAQSMRAGRVPPTVGTSSPTFTDTVATTAFDASAYDTVVCSSNAFGGAHAALVLRHA